MHRFLILLVAALTLCGCATPQQKLEKRKQEKYSAYSSLTPEQRTAVDHGQIVVGLPMDGVYIALGKPDQVVNSGSEAGTFTTWIYLVVYLQSVYSWGWGYPGYACGPYGYYGYGYGGPGINYYPVNYVSGEVKFHNGLVSSWSASPGALH